MISNDTSKWVPMVAGRRKTKKKITIFEFDGINEFVEQAKVKSEWSDKGWTLSSRSTGDADWAGTKTFEEAAKLAIKGWDEGTKLLTKQVDEVELIANSPEPRPAAEYDVAGYYPNVPLYCSGEPMHMVAKTAEQKIIRKQIELIVNCAVSCGVTKESVANYGAALVSYVDRLENAGVRVGITLALTYELSAKERGTEIYVRIKHAQESVPLSVLAFTLVHIATHRRLGFSIAEQVYWDWWKDSFQFGYGHPTSVLVNDMDENAWVIDRLEKWGNWNTPANSLKSMGDKLIKLAEGHNDVSRALGREPVEPTIQTHHPRPDSWNQAKALRFIERCNEADYRRAANALINMFAWNTGASTGVIWHKEHERLNSGLPPSNEAMQCIKSWASK